MAMGMREKLIKVLCIAHNEVTDASLFDDATYAQQIEIEADYLIANDVVPVVRCKDCIHWYDKEETCLKIYSDGAVSPYAWQFRKADDFCSYGERKDNGT